MNKNLGLLLGAIFAILTLKAFAQDANNKIIVEITKEVNGEKKTFKGEYNSTEEMHADPNYQEFSEGGQDSSFWLGSGDHDVAIHLDEMEDMKKGMLKFFDSNGKDFFFHFDMDSAALLHFDMEDFEKLKERFENFGFSDIKEAQEERSGLKRIEVSEVEAEFGKRGSVGKNQLELEDLSLYSAPRTEGKLHVKFNTTNEGELAIKLSDKNGTDVFSRYFVRFSGRYSESIDLSDQEEGVYLLEIIQGKKKLIRKITIHVY